MSNGERSLFSITNPNDITLYCHCDLIPEDFEEENISSSDADMEGLSFSYHDTYKDGMLKESPEKIYEGCCKIAAVEDVYFHLTETEFLSDKQKEYITKVKKSTTPLKIEGQGVLMCGLPHFILCVKVLSQKILLYIRHSVIFVVFNR